MSSFCPIAIVGAACRLPGCDSVEAFWKTLLDGATHCGPIPESRFNRALLFDPKPGVLNKTYSDLAGLIEYRSVDRAACPLPDGAEKNFDVAHLELARTAADACRDAGFDPARYPFENSGVFIGHTRPGTVSQDWAYRFCLPEIVEYLDESPTFAGLFDGEIGRKFAEKIAEKLEKSGGADAKAAFFDALERDAAAGLAPILNGKRPFYRSGDAALLIAQSLKINGPTAVFNAACASSSQAISQAIFALANRRVDSAIAGGASFFHSDTLVLFAGSRSLTKKRSCPFDRDADGLIVGEGNVVFVLKRLDDAMRDGDPVRAVFVGVGLSSDGRGKSLWAPRREGQELAVRKAYSDASELRKVDYVEAHATSTALGDATEIAALSSVFSSVYRDCDDGGREGERERKIPLGAAKGNVGHTLEVAGAAGVLKAALTLQRGIAPPIGGLRALNPKIPWADVPFFAPTEATRLEKTDENRPRRAAVNSFGVGGLNVHLVLDEFVPEYWEERTRRGRPFPAVAVAGDGSDSGRSEYLTRLKEPSQTVVVPPLALKKPPVVAPETAVAVVGFGCVFPDAYSSAAYRDLLESGKTAAFRGVPTKTWNLDVFARKYLARKELTRPIVPFRAGVVDRYEYDWRKNKVPPKQVQNASPLQFMSLDAVEEAFAVFGKKPAEVRENASVVFGTGFGGDFSNKMNVALALPAFLEKLKGRLRALGVSEDAAARIAEEYSRILHRKMPALLDETGSFTPSALASRATKTLDLTGGAVAVESENGSFGAALACAVDQLVVGANDLAICVGGEQDLGPTVYDALCSGRLLAENPEISPFDAAADGFVPGEGCGALILKRLDDARRDGNRIFAVIRGIGAATGPDLYENVRRAADRAGVRSANAVPRFVEAPFCGIADRDAALVDAIADLAASFGEIGNVDAATGCNGERIALGTAGDRLGRFGAGESAASFLKILFEIEKREVFPCVGLRRLAAAFAKRRERVDVPKTARKIGSLNAEKTIRSGLVAGENSVWYIRLESEAKK